MHAALDEHGRMVREHPLPGMRQSEPPRHERREADDEGQLSTVDTVFDEREVLRSASGAWWVFLVSGIAWLVIAVLVFRFDITSVRSIGILFGVMAIAAGVNEFIAITVSTIGWKFVHGLMGVVFVLVGLFAFIEPGSAFAALASVIGFFFLFKGIFDIAVAITTKGEFDLWWLQLLAGHSRDRARLLGGRQLRAEGDPAARLRRAGRAVERCHRALPGVQAEEPEATPGHGLIR